MKKNITINLCGRLFAIDEDAYELLSTYLKSLRTFFRQREGDEEIADDIEARVAELFDEQKQKGAEAINIEYVQEVIHRIGQPDEMEEEESTAPSNSLKGEDSDSSEAQAGTNPLPVGGGREGAKRLYRNPADKKLMGVLSGFAAYFGGDVLWWRLGYAAIVLLSFAGSSYNFLWFMPHRYLYFRIWF
nr:PspC domain-containing protein [Bacteroidaceae bacterium]